MLIMVNQIYRTSDMIEPYVSDKDYKKIKPIINYISDNLTADLSLETLSKKDHPNYE